MSFLTHAKIKTKILCLIVPVCIIGIVGAGLVAVNYNNTDSQYSDFITKNNGTVIGISRASQRLTSLSALIYEMILAEPGTPAFKNSETNYNQAVDKMISRLEDTRAIAPAENLAMLDDLIVRSKTITAGVADVLKLDAQGKQAEALAAFEPIKQNIDTMTGQVRDWIDTSSKELVKQTEILMEHTDKTILYVLSALALLFTTAIGLVLFVLSRGITKPIERLRARMIALADGKTEEDVAGVGRKDEVGQMASAVLVFRNNAVERLRLEAEAEAGRSLSERERMQREAEKAREAAELKLAVDGLGTGLDRLSDGDVAYRIATPFAGELETLRNNFNSSVAKLQDALQAVGENARAIDAGANEIRSAADDLSKRTEQQAASVEETAAALEQITTTVKDSTRRAEEAGTLVAQARAGAEKSGNVVREAVTAMHMIEKSSGEISSIIGVIDEIAFQTNLLALNAGVEAARAGDAGKGFAVVAQEVRELAQRSAQAAKEIKALIASSGGHVQTGVRLVAQTGSSLETIVGEVQEINRHVTAIVESAREQSTGLQEINMAVNTMDQGTQQNAAMVEQSTAASYSLAKEANALNVLLSRFNIGDGAGTGSGAGNNNRRFHKGPQNSTYNTKPVPSPARALGARLSGAFAGSAAGSAAAANSAKDWEDF